MFWSISSATAQGTLLNCTIDISPSRLQRDLNKNNICAQCLTQGGPGQTLHFLGTTMTDLFATVIAGQTAATPVPHQSSWNKLSLLLGLWDADALCLKQVF